MACKKVNLEKSYLRFKTNSLVVYKEKKNWRYSLRLRDVGNYSVKLVCILLDNKLNWEDLTNRICKHLVKTLLLL